MKVIAVFEIENDRIFDYSCDLHVWNELGGRLVKEDVLLRPLPPKGIGENEFTEGWNACLDAVTGENE